MDVQGFDSKKSLNDAKVFRGYYSGKKQSTQMKDYKAKKSE